jgi:hypothetical protein
VISQERRAQSKNSLNLLLAGAVHRPEIEV